MSNRPGGANGRRSAPREGSGRNKAVAWTVGIIGSIVPIVVIVGVVAFLFTYMTVSVPKPGDIKQNQVATITYDNGATLATIVPPEGNRTDVALKDIPEGVQNAVIAAEDREFRTNSGFSVRGYARAVLGKLTGNDSAGGGSTITQQYVKNALVGDQVSYQRKFKELAVSTKMATSWSKDQIMEAYLNTIYFGRGAYGIAAASKAYFNKDVKDLTVPEAAVLASSIRSPSYYDPAVNHDAAVGRWHYVINGMVKIGAITQQQADTMEYPKVLNQSPTEVGVTQGPAGLIKSQVLSELSSLNISEQEVRTEGLKITTTIDPQVQRALVNNANGKLDGEPDNLRTAAVSIDPRTGAVRGYFGGNDGQGYDYAQAGLQTGSSFKVFALAAALEQGIPLSKVYSSAPYTTSTGQDIENSDGESCGSCNLAVALKMSLNTVYYRLMMDLDGQARAVADAAHQAGVAESFGDIAHTLTNADGNVEGGVVLGQYPSRVIDMASAYATFAASGIYRAPHFVQKVETSDGNVLYERTPDKGERRFPAKVADNLTAAMEPIAAYSRGHALDGGSRPSASKTGTTQLGDTGYNKDAWMVGYTPQLSTAVWVGTDNGAKLLNYSGSIIYGSGLPSDIWQSAMDDALQGQEIMQFPEPAEVGGQAGVPTTYQPTTTYAPSTTEQRTAPSPTQTQEQTQPALPSYIPPELTIAPGITIPLPGGGQQQQTTEQAPDDEQGNGVNNNAVPGGGAGTANDEGDGAGRSGNGVRTGTGAGGGG
ncbi:transglycosylase domain-containing protein [Gordonia jinhuaensis]|uniref:Penicillin-binding protein 1A n=2 Tax=Gordonia jinhuaensis TaxID=1517702 RepID=A0A916TDE3_9ACTN|nr:penicillin-binding protein 1A [Gordonia jinhuaensis]